MDTTLEPDISHTLVQVSIKALGCRGPLSDPRGLAEACISAVEEAELVIVAQTSFGFTPHGATAALILAQSHLVVSTWPEHRLAIVDISVCAPRTTAMFLWRLLTNYLRPTDSDLHERTLDLTGAQRVEAGT